MAVTVIELRGDELAVLPQGWHRLFAFRREIAIPRAAIVTVEHDILHAQNGPGFGRDGRRRRRSSHRRKYFAGMVRMFRSGPERGETSFWIRQHAESCITIRMTAHQFDYVTVEVDDPAAEVERIRAWLA